MLKLFTKTKYQIFYILFLFTFSITLFAQEIIHKEIEYSQFGNFSNIIPSKFLSEIIEIPIKNAEPFIAIGLNATLINMDKNAQFSIRASVNGNTWTEWQLLTNDSDAELIKNKFISSLAFFDNSKKYIQFYTNTLTSIEKLKFSFISPGKTSTQKIENNIIKSQNKKLLRALEIPEFVSRKSWGCPQNENESSRSLTNVTHLIIHHSAANTVSNDYAAVVRTYWDWHVNGNGWDDIGYNWLVDPNGVLYKGRAWKSDTEENILGAHNSGKNSGTSGICFIGNYVSDIPNEIGLNKVADIAAFLCDKYEIDPSGKSYHAAIGKENDNITGHGQSGGGTSCPGTQLINRMQSIRELTNSKIIDITASPIVISTYPNSQIDSAYLSKNILIEFSHSMNKSSVENAFSITPNTFGTISWNSAGNMLYYKPLPTFSKQTNYSIVINKTAMSNWNVELANDVVLNFVTKLQDNLSLVSSYPKNGDNNVETNATIILQFDGSLNSNSLGGNVLFKDMNGNSVNIKVDAREYSNGIIKFTPQSPLEEGTVYSIELKKEISSTDNYTFGIDKTISFTTKTNTSVQKDSSPNTFYLISAYPNPFNPTTTIEYTLEKYSNVKIVIYDIIGNLVTTLINGEMNPGTHKILFNANNLPSGIYFSQIQTNNVIKTIKLLLTK